MKGRIRCYQLQKIILKSLFLYIAPCFHGKRADSLMQLLPVAAGLDCIQQVVFQAVYFHIFFPPP